MAVCFSEAQAGLLEKQPRVCCCCFCQAQVPPGHPLAAVQVGQLSASGAQQTPSEIRTACLGWGGGLQLHREERSPPRTGHHGASTLAFSVIPL